MRLYFAVHSGHLAFANNPSPHLEPNGGIGAAVDAHAAQLGELKQVADPCLGTLEYFGTPRQEEVEVGLNAHVPGRIAQLDAKPPEDETLVIK